VLKGAITIVDKSVKEMGLLQYLQENLTHRSNKKANWFKNAESG
jgi:hypothetical protein